MKYVFGLIPVCAERDEIKVDWKYVYLQVSSHTIVPTIDEGFLAVFQELV